MARPRRFRPSRNSPLPPGNDAYNWGIADAPKISVIIPVYNAEDFLGQCLEHLAASSELPLELIVVDDGSTDRSRAVAEAAGARVLMSPKARSGPAVARNIGAREAAGDILYFIDSDVLVAPHTIQRIRQSFAEDPELAALIGSYDDDPGDRDFLSQYKNLMHHFVHQGAKHDACTFWSGCGAIRRGTFLRHGGFDESYGRPAIEDIELGYRLGECGYKMVLDPELQVKHLKKWTFWGLLKTDVLDRGIPWTELILRDRRMPNDLNLQLSQRVSVALAFVLVGMALFGAIYWGGYFLTPLFAALFVVLGRFWGESVSSKDSRRGLLWTGAILAVIIVLLALYDMVALIPTLSLAYALLVVRHRYNFDAKRRRDYVRIATAVVTVLVVGLTMFYLPNHAFVWATHVVVLALIVLNTQFYLFLAAKQHKFFAVAAIPFHLLYHLYSGISFIAGAGRYYWHSLRHPVERRHRSQRGVEPVSTIGGAPLNDKRG